ncbi:uncharacterized protein LOC129796837 [Lutzomyia longipalpis]|uniref:uncharacterized protein LOC129796837 n=1 Tax=Lutzomyia longipalpis TaxID=7200 RepID=UPI0024843095|nr:uncharacterized protein LOC129796837 [Lutzomyia longipalpis]
MRKLKDMLNNWKWWFVVIYLVIGIVNCSGENYTESSRKLSRRKRYLMFPEGSSLQVIYDQTIPVVALPLVFTVGVTVAIAYELPSKPLSELAEDFRKKFDVLKNNNSKADNINHITYVSKDKIWKDRYSGINRHDLYYQKDQNIASNIQYQVKRKNDPPHVYYENNKPNPWIENEKLKYYFGNKYQSFGNEDKKFNYIKMLANRYTTPVPQRPAQRKDSSNRSFNRKVPHRKHIIQPVFGKRSIDDVDEDEEELHKIYHISTRQRLYNNIERYLDDKGISGKECILKSLCETRNNKDLPNTFMGAILKSIFRLPHLNIAGEHEVKDYMEAHHSVDDCIQTYSICKSNFWTSEFVK